MSHERENDWDKGDFNYTIGIIGYQGTGKTRFAHDFLLAEQKRIGAYVLISDMQGNMTPKEYPDIHRYESMNEFHAALRERKTAMVLHAPPLFPDGALNEAKQIARLSLGADNHGAPVIVYIDEMALFHEMKQNAFERSITALPYLSNRRHWHVGLIWGCQSPRFFHSSVFIMTQMIYLFRDAGIVDIRRLTREIFPDEYIERLRTLPDWHYYHWKPGAGLLSSTPKGPYVIRWGVTNDGAADREWSRVHEGRLMIWSVDESGKGQWSYVRR